MKQLLGNLSDIHTLQYDVFLQYSVLQTVQRSRECSAVYDTEPLKSFEKSGA